MTSEFSRALDLARRDNNSSILVEDVGSDDLDLNECWIGLGVSSAPHWRVSYPEKKVPVGSMWGPPRFTWLSSNVRNAGAAVAVRAKQLRIPTLTCIAIGRSRKSTRNLPRAASLPTQHVLNESDIDDFGKEPEPEDDNDSSETSNKKCSMLHPPYSCTQGCS
ncbi:hypothetical protein GN244_ATG03738 [Phytophthora infestans]|uniref:Uncharacterized protein n=1 Tax=Phytophthora infestans TaxID=4787 RepID=A0A833WZV5_PHYIN|nr:hypothetical protein GN244_ATG03738 [Phytophthora infestans]KAF4135709.1 hypothetical protein GN958_ATG15106 [Phytophthora infestans]KAF4150517.1 hypothetical protein GN958_ATG00292 [Phytophthora infestans]